MLSLISVSFHFIQVKFNSVVHVTGIALQGRSAKVYQVVQYVTSYKFLYSKDCLDFTTFTDTDGLEMVNIKMWVGIVCFF